MKKKIQVNLHPIEEDSKENESCAAAVATELTSAAVGSMDKPEDRPEDQTDEPPDWMEEDRPDDQTEDRPDDQPGDRPDEHESSRSDSMEPEQKQRGAVVVAETGISESEENTVKHPGGRCQDTDRVVCQEPFQDGDRVGFLRFLCVFGFTISRVLLSIYLFCVEFSGTASMGGQLTGVVRPIYVQN